MHTDAMMSLLPDECYAVFQQVFEQWQRLDIESDWRDVRLVQQYRQTILRITTEVTSHQEPNPDPAHDNDNEAGRDNEQDEEVLSISHSPTPPISIVYDIAYSPTYRVPVLYLTLQKPTHQTKQARLSLDDIYNLLVLPDQRPQLQSTGVMGALTLTDHPLTNLPVYFVHPCRTTEAMQTLTNGREVTPAEYLMLWMGIIGRSVGLTMPVELAQSLMDQI